MTFAVFLLGVWFGGCIMQGFSLYLTECSVSAKLKVYSIILWPVMIMAASYGYALGRWSKPRISPHSP